MRPLLAERLAASLAIAAILIAARPVPHDEIVKVRGQNLHVQITGGGGPTVVFEAGLGNDTSTWRAVAGPVSRFARVVLYDRAGLGKSLPLAHPGVPVTADAVAASLHALLRKIGLRRPFILVGHSLGGLYMQMFARRYPWEVAGLILIDSASAEAPPQLKTRAKLEPGSAAYLEEQGVAASNKELRRAGPFPDVPLTVVAATDHGSYFKSWEPLLMRLQRRLAKLSPQGQLVVAHGSGHDIQADRPALVVSVVRSMVRKLRSARPPAR